MAAERVQFVNMRDESNEFLGLLCNLYIVALLAALPLYTGEGYWQLGDTKYLLFRNVTLLCLGCWLILGLPGRMRAVAGRARAFGAEGWRALARPFGPVDLAVIAYGACVLLSALCTSYGRLAWFGYEGWFMGAVSQFLFIGIYFFVSRQYDGAAWPLYLGELAFFGVTLFGLLHRLGIDPLGLQTGWTSRDWEYSHMLSTLGNINWLCGFYSVALAFPVVRFLREERLWMQIPSYAVTVSAFVLLGIQGSQGGLLILGVCFTLCIILGRNRPVVLKKVFLQWTGFFLCMPLMGQLMKMRGEKAAVAADGNVFAVTKWYFWIACAAVCGMFALLFGAGRRGASCGEGMKTHGGREKFRGKEFRGEAGKTQREKTEPRGGRRHRRHRAFLAAVLLGGLAMGIVLVFLFFLRHIDDGFGSGRGLLWRIAAESFEQADWKDKLLGAGPDCYAEAVFNKLGRAGNVWAGDHWEFAVFTNAHNEILNQLCNTGILGTVSYLAIFLIGFRRYRDRPDRKDARNGSPIPFAWAGLLALAMYGMHSLVSFQQVLNTPLLFLALGLCEHEMREKSALFKVSADPVSIRGQRVR